MRGRQKFTALRGLRRATSFPVFLAATYYDMRHVFTHRRHQRHSIHHYAPPPPPPPYEQTAK